MTVKDMVLQDLPDLYPGLTRAGVEHVQSILDHPIRGGQGLASELAAIAPVIAKRLKSLEAPEIAEYVRMLNSAAVLVLQMWTANSQRPPYRAIVAGVQALDG